MVRVAQKNLLSMESMFSECSWPSGNFKVGFFLDEKDILLGDYRHLTVPLIETLRANAHSQNDLTIEARAKSFSEMAHLFWGVTLCSGPSIRFDLYYIIVCSSCW